MHPHDVLFYADSLYLLEQLQAQKIDGVLFDMYTMVHLTQFVQDGADDITKIRNHTQVRR